jgi:peptide-methionine (S)-S-oxide reductase
MIVAEDHAEFVGGEWWMFFHREDFATVDENQGATERAIFAAGCFWGVEEAFRAVPGVLDVVVGYTGGIIADPSYERVCFGKTGHAEAVEVTYDPSAVSYEELLDVFWALHDPTTLNRQGPDIGTPYRSAIFYVTPEQEAIAVRSRGEAQKRLTQPIVTEITPASAFYRAEEYHQSYFAKRASQ